MLTETDKKDTISKKALEVLVDLSKKDQDLFFSVFLIDRGLQEKIKGVKFYPADIPKILDSLIKEGLVSEVKVLDDYGFIKSAYKANLENIV